MADALPNFNADDIAKLVDEVQVQLAVMAKAEVAKIKPLKKADGDDAPPSSDEGSAPDASEASGPPAGGESSGPPAEASAPAGGAPGGDPAAAGGDPAAAAGPVDPAALQAEYVKLGSEQGVDALKMHVEAASAALAAAMGAGDPMAGGAPAPAAAGPAAGPPPPLGGDPAAAGGPPPPMGKKEMKPEGNGGDIKLAKAEAEIAALKAQVAETNTLATQMASTFKAFVSKPLRKAETSLTPAKPVETKLNKSEVKAKLEAKIPDRSLTKHDRELISKVLCNEPVSDAAIAHLLK